MRRRLTQGPYGYEEPAINLTPLIDVVFVILIMFIVVAPLLELDRVQLAENLFSAKEKKGVQEASPLAIYVHDDNSIVFEGRQMTLAELAIHLKEARNGNAHAKLQLFHDRQAHFGIYQAIKNCAEAAGFEYMDVILKPSP